MSEWIEWKAEPGKVCPVANDLKLMVRWEGGIVDGPFHSQCVCGWGGGITGYRIVEPVAEPEAHMMSLPMEPAPDPLQAQAEMIVALTEERDALRAEVERLNNELCAARYEASVERLRKGKDDGKLDRSFDYGNDRVDRAACGGDTVVDHGGSASTGVRLLMTRSNTMDHRLGTPQPDGEPCEPMSARKWRWLP